MDAEFLQYSAASLGKCFLAAGLSHGAYRKYAAWNFVGCSKGMLSFEAALA
jgi:hypothetical protein